MLCTVNDMHIIDHLKGSEYGSKEAIDRAVQHFEKNAKRKVYVAIIS